MTRPDGAPPSPPSPLTTLAAACVRTGSGAIFIPYTFDPGREIDVTVAMLEDSKRIHNATGEAPGLIPADFKAIEASSDRNPLGSGWVLTLVRESDLNQEATDYDIAYPPVPTMSQLREKRAIIIGRPESIADKRKNITVAGTEWVSPGVYQIIESEGITDLTVIGNLIVDAYTAGFKAALTEVRRINSGPGNAEGKS